MELAGTVRGGRFVEGFDGEQFATPDAVTRLRRARPSDDDETDDAPRVAVSAADPLNLSGIVTPDARVAVSARTRVQVG